MIDNENIIRAHSAPGTYEKILEFLTGEKRGRILDAPAGEGALFRKLKDMSFEVYAADINTENFKLKDVEFKKVDLNKTIDYPAGFFDYAVCVEGIEHLESPYHLIREFFRVLAPQGKLIITTPNIVSFFSRIKFLLFGSFRYFNSKIEIEDKTLIGHIMPIGFPELEFILHKTGFVIEKIATNNMEKKPGLCFLGFAAAILKWLNRRFNKAYNESLLMQNLLFGEILIVKTSKV